MADETGSPEPIRAPRPGPSSLERLATYSAVGMTVTGAVSHIFVADTTAPTYGKSHVENVTSDDRDRTVASYLAADQVTGIGERDLARRVLTPQRAQIQAQRNALATKKATGTLDAREARTLAYLEWQLDRIEDSTIGEHLDQLERLASLQEAFAEKLGKIAKQFGPTKRR